MASTPEGRIKAMVKKELDARGWKRAGSDNPMLIPAWYFMPVSNGMGVHGIPDFMLTYYGISGGIECKKDNRSEPTANQQDRMKEINDAGGVARVVYDLQTLHDYLYLLEDTRRG
jgi:hypothetical protein